jgi:hypothetical protein
MTLNIPQDPPTNVSVTTKSMFCHGHLSFRTSIQSKTGGPELKRAVDKHKPKNVKDLERICIEEWSIITPKCVPLTLWNITGKDSMLLFLPEVVVLNEECQ